MEPTKKLKQAITDYKSGKADAFAVLYEESKKYVYVCIYKIMKDCDNALEVINDLMQDTYMEISRHISQLEKEDSFLSWVGSIATRQCYAYLKKNRQYTLLSEEDTLEKLVEDENLIPEAIMQNREKQRLIREIIDTKLTPIQRLCVIAFYYNEQKQSEIAEDLGIPENTVKTNLSRAKAKIKEGILELEKKEGTRLYSVAPFLLLLFNQEIQECVVPAEMAKRILEVATTAGKKGATMSLKAKLITAVSGVVVLGAIGGFLIIGRGRQEAPEESQEEPQEDISIGLEIIPKETESPQPEILYDSWPEWALVCRELLLRAAEDTVEYYFDLNDFDGDGIPEVIILEPENILIGALDDYGGLWPLFEYDRYEILDLISEYHSEETYIYGYGMNENEIVKLELGIVQNGEIVSRNITFDTAIYNRNSEIESIHGMVAYKGEANPVQEMVGMIAYQSWSGQFPSLEWQTYNEEDGLEAFREYAACFNEIVYTPLEVSAIDERIIEYIQSGNRPRSRRSEEEIDALTRWDFESASVLFQVEEEEVGIWWD